MSDAKSTSVLDEVAEATRRLAASVERLDPAELAGSSVLAGWTRGHVLTHLARNADGLRNLLLSARTGEPLKMYASPATRVADIDAGAARHPEVIVADVLESSHRFVVEARAMPADAWSAVVAFSSGQPNPPQLSADRFVVMRLEEVEVHHADLGCDYGFADTPSAVARRLLDRFALRRAAQGIRVHLVTDDIGWQQPEPAGDRVPVIRGSSAAMLGWLAGRSRDALSAGTSGGDLPVLPPLG